MAGADIAGRPTPPGSGPAGDGDAKGPRKAASARGGRRGGRARSLAHARAGAGAGAGAGGPSLVDSAERALHNWLAGGRYRPGDRLPPEHEVAAMLGVSRGTLRSALERLERGGEIVRRQGSGTFVGRVSLPSLGERLERLEPYSSLAERRGLKLTCQHLQIEERAVGEEVGEALGLAPIARALTVSRTLVANGAPVAVMFDVVHPGVSLPDERTLRSRLEAGQMVLDVLIERGVAVTFARTRVLPYLLSGRERTGKLLGVRRATAVLQMEELIYSGRDERVAYSRDLFAPGGNEVMVMRSLESTRPVPVANVRGSRARRSAGNGRGPARRAGARNGGEEG
jgi:GntR family transcriptional regulator